MESPISPIPPSPSPGLIVFVPGIGKNRGAEFVRRVAREAGDSCRVVSWDHRIKSRSVIRTPEKAAENLAAFIDAEAREVGTDHIVLIGHSLGGLIARSAWLLGHGYGADCRADWAKAVRRIVLLGSPSGGYQLKGWSRQRILYELATPFADFAIEHAKSGGYWVTDLRLRWLQAFRALPEAQLPAIVEVVGGDDRLVTADDVRDTRKLTGNCSITVADTDHAGLVEVSDVRRWRVLRRAVFGPVVASKAPPEFSDKKVFFIVHGIRASADDQWVSKLKEVLTDDHHIVDAPSTGFFSAWEFALPFIRNRKAHVFLKRYGDLAIKHNPDNFSVLGHSNGTYMLGRAMQNVSAVRFRNILLAGTVLTPNYQWDLLMKREQIGAFATPGDTESAWVEGKVHNERVRIDVPVGILAALLNGLWPWNKGVGAAGVVGFWNVPESVSQDKHFFRGGHEGALDPSDARRLKDIARFLQTGESTHGELHDPSRLFQSLSRAMKWLAWPVVLGIIVLLIWLTIFGFGVLGWWALLVVGGPLLVIYVLLRSV